jgi:PilZ domain
VLPNMTYTPEFTLPPIDWRLPAKTHHQPSPSSPVSTVIDELPERRGDMRHLTRDPVLVQTMCGAKLQQDGLVLDISDGGLMLELQRPLSKQMTVEVAFSGSALIIFGEVKHCRPARTGYRAGVQIQDIAMGSRRERHLEDDDLFLYLQGRRLTSAEVIRFRHHLKGCQACAARLDDTRQVLDRVHSGAGRASSGQD